MEDSRVQKTRVFRVKVDVDKGKAFENQCENEDTNVNAKLKRLIDDEWLRHRLGRNAFKLSREHSLKKVGAKLKAIYEQKIKDNLRKQISIKTDVDGININANLDELADKAVEEMLVKISEDYASSQTIPGIVEAFNEGYKKAFWENYEKEFKSIFPTLLYQECRSRISIIKSTHL